ncbi:PQQ-binding-like beta-propeller repeat protein [Roseivivax marinus]|uniref:YncE family protein n=1 Tax=Roseivivax marinus TaxID=1379903 RepID=UPI001F04CAFF|nr:PQQ-binding-like beta-propeller repeat protein [Roseivivax marinus]UMA64740.1 PQQ-binding-like beta-propeller repeat protein [Roseivivax marinus]
MRRARDLALILSLAVPAGAAADMAYITNQNGDSLSVLDLTTRTEVLRFDLPGQPAGIAAGPDGRLYTVSPDSKTVRRLDPETGDALAEVRLDGGPTGIAYDASRGQVFVSDWYNARLWALDAETLEVEAELETAAAPAGLALSPDDRWLAAAERDADRVTLWDAGTLEPHARISVGTRPYGLRFAPDGRLFVGNVGTNDLSVIEPEAGTVTATIPVGERPYGVAFAQGRAFVTNQYAGTISVIALDTLDTVATLNAGEYPEGVDDAENGAIIVVANWFDNSVSLIDAATLEVMEEIATGDGPRAFGEFILGGETP